LKYRAQCWNCLSVPARPHYERSSWARSGRTSDGDLRASALHYQPRKALWFDTLLLHLLRTAAKSTLRSNTPSIGIETDPVSRGQTALPATAFNLRTITSSMIDPRIRPKIVRKARTHDSEVFSAVGDMRIAFRARYWCRPPPDTTTNTIMITLARGGLEPNEAIRLANKLFLR
jgi:hypothetical protein